MNINGKKPSNKHKFNNDYASFVDIQQEDRFNKFKPIIKALILLVVIVATIFIIKPYFQNNDQSNSYETPQGVQTKTNEIAKLSQCLKNIPSSPETNDPEFYPKIISNYDSMLSCYDEYPKASSTLSRDNIVSLRQDAIDGSGTYKDTYLANNSYEYSVSNSRHLNPTTGCDYSLSEGEYIKCTDNYNSTKSTTSSNSITTSAPVTENIKPADTGWCIDKKIEVDSLYSKYQEVKNNVYAVNTEINKITTARPDGFTGTQAQLDSWRNSERQRLEIKKTTLEATQNSSKTAYDNALYEYNAKTCY